MNIDIKNKDFFPFHVYRVSNFTFSIVNGEWGDWGSWSACDGRREVRRRSCDNPTPINNGAYCPGPPVQEKNCGNNKNCTTRLHMAAC